MLVSGVIDHAFFPLFDEDVLWCQEEVGNETPRPPRERDDKLVFVLFVHRLFDLRHVCFDRGIVPSSPVLQCIGTADVCVNGGRAPHCHDTNVLLH